MWTAFSGAAVTAIHVVDGECEQRPQTPAEQMSAVVITGPGGGEGGHGVALGNLASLPPPQAEGLKGLRTSLILKAPAILLGIQDKIPLLLLNSKKRQISAPAFPKHLYCTKNSIYKQTHLGRVS